MLAASNLDYLYVVLTYKDFTSYKYFTIG